MAVLRGIDDADPLRSGSMLRAAVHEERRRTRVSTLLGVATLACPCCDAPIALAAGPVSPADLLVCPFCDRRAPTRDFLSLKAPTRPARVEVRVIQRAR